MMPRVVWKLSTQFICQFLDPIYQYFYYECPVHIPDAYQQVSITPGYSVKEILGLLCQCSGCMYYYGMHTDLLFLCSSKIVFISRILYRVLEGPKSNTVVLDKYLTFCLADFLNAESVNTVKALYFMGIIFCGFPHAC